jgi:hypothetical protein
MNEIINNIRYISFQDFLKQTENVRNDIFNYIENNKIENIIFFINEGYQKSNFWTFLLNFKYFDDRFNKKMYIYFNKDDNYDNIFLNYIENIKIKTLVIYTDDMTYSGSQIALTQNFINLCNKNKEYVYFTLLVPYLTFVAKNKINYTECKNFYESTEIDTNHNIISDLGLKLWFLISNSTKYNNTFRSDNYMKVLNRLSLYTDKDDRFWIYFQHKIADSVSIYNGFLSALPYITYDNLTKRFKLELLGHIAKNCKVEELGCPPTLYKTLDYKFNGQSIITDYMYNSSPDYTKDKRVIISYYKFYYNGKSLDLKEKYKLKKFINKFIKFILY